MILVNAQWQGGGDLSTYKAAGTIAGEYLKGVDYSRVPIDVSGNSMQIENNIKGCSAIRKQTEMAYDILKESNPSKLFTIGGGCDADVASILYMNEFYGGDLAVLWFDAHGDINSPDESDTHLFYGMPARAILGGCGDKYPVDAGRWVESGQLVNIGGRDLDASETAFFKEMKIQRIPAREPDLAGAVLKAAEKTGKKHVYIHFDLDVLDPSVFPATPLPVPGGAAIDDAVKALGLLKEKYSVVGFGLYEYLPEKDKDRSVKRFVDYGLAL
ncbi:MAG: arginase family protein [Anaerovoracaceae bacterium]|jgi:arginase